MVCSLLFSPTAHGQLRNSDPEISLSQHLLLIRHAATDLAGKLCGHLDPPLNVAGAAQAASLAHLLRAVPVDRIYTSDLLRAVQTAAPLAHMRGIPVLERRDLREISFGAWEGMSWHDLHAPNSPPLGIESSNAPPPGGESFHDFHLRVLHALNEITLQSPDGTTAVITHLGVIRDALITLAQINPASDLLRRIEYCSVHRVLVSEGTWKFDGRL